MICLTITSPDEAATGALAAALARQCVNGDCLLLSGDLGAGKTVFARGFIRALTDERMEIVSPTFTLLQTYPIEGGVISHFDLYRLRSPEELMEIGLEDALSQGITLIEWPEMARNFTPSGALEIGIRMGGAAEERVIEFSGAAEVWQDRLEKMTFLN